MLEKSNLLNRLTLQKYSSLKTKVYIRSTEIHEGTTELQKGKAEVQEAKTEQYWTLRNSSSLKTEVQVWSTKS